MKNRVSETLLALIALFYMPTSVLASCVIEPRGVSYELNSDCGYHGPPSGVVYQDICYQQYLYRKYDYEARCFRYWDEKKLDELVQQKTTSNEFDDEMDKLQKQLNGQVNSMENQLNSLTEEQERASQYEAELQRQLEETKAELEALEATAGPEISPSPSIEPNQEESKSGNIIVHFFSGLWQRILDWFD